MVLGCDGLVLANELRQSQRVGRPTSEPASKGNPFDYSNRFRSSVKPRSLLNRSISRLFHNSCPIPEIPSNLLPSPAHGLPLDALAIRLYHGCGQRDRVHLLRGPKGQGRRKKTLIVHRARHRYVILNAYP